MGGLTLPRDVAQGDVTKEIQSLDLRTLDNLPACLPDGKPAAFYVHGIPPVDIQFAKGDYVRSDTVANEIYFASLSPDGTFAAAFQVPKKSSDPPQIILFDAKGDRTRATFELPGTTANLVPFSNLAWTSNGAAVVFLLQENGNANLWMQLIDSSNPKRHAPPTQITHLKEGLYTGFAISPDGKRAALAHNAGKPFIVRLSGVIEPPKPKRPSSYIGLTSRP
jgi:Tol biopolymer transport system component